MHKLQMRLTPRNAWHASQAGSGKLHKPAAVSKELTGDVARSGFRGIPNRAGRQLVHGEAAANVSRANSHEGAGHALGQAPAD